METSNNQRLDEQQRQLDFEGIQLDWRQRQLDFEQLFHQGQQSVWEFRKRQQQIEFERLLLQGRQILLDFSKRLEEIPRKMKQNDELVKQMQESESQIVPTSQGSAPQAADPSIRAILASNSPPSDMIASDESESGVGLQRREINHCNLVSIRQTSQDKDLGVASVKISEGCSDPTISWGIGVRDQETSIEITSKPLSSPQLEVEGARQELVIQSADSKVTPCPLEVVVFEELGDMDGFKGMLADQMERSDAHKVFVKMPIERVRMLMTLVKDRISVSGEMGSIVSFGTRNVSFGNESNHDFMKVPYDRGRTCIRMLNLALISVPDSDCVESVNCVVLVNLKFIKGCPMSMPFDRGKIEVATVSYMEVDAYKLFVFYPGGGLLSHKMPSTRLAEIDDVLELVDVHGT